MWTGAILTGGDGTRLGGVDKGGLRVGASSILDRQLGLLGSLTSHVLIVTSNRARCRGVAVPVVEDVVPGAGAFGGLYTVLTAAPTDQVIVLASDMPFVSAALIEQLVALGSTADAAVTCDQTGRHPLCASYQRRVASRLRARIDEGDLRVGAAVAELHVAEVGPEALETLDPSGRLLMNVNTPADYARARDAV